MIEIIVVFGAFIGAIVLTILDTKYGWSGDDGLDDMM